MSYIVNKLVIADIERDSIPEDAANLLKSYVYWRDEILDEHICNIEEVGETNHFNRLTEESKAIVIEIQKEVAESGASYVRLIN